MAQKQRRRTDMQLGFKKVHPDAKIPTYAHEGDAGMDVYAVEDVYLSPFTPTLVKTGLIAEIPDGYEIQVRPRSGLALKEGITVWNGPGTVDQNFRGEIGVILLWAPRSYIEISAGTKVFSPIDWFLTKQIHKGDRIAQLVVAPVTRVEPVEISEVSETERGKGGFGSTGV